MPGGVKLIDSTLVIVLHNGEQEIERELASPADALRVALMMLARRGRLETGDVLKVVSPNWTASRVQNVGSWRRTRPIDAHRQSVRFGLKMTQTGHSPLMRKNQESHVHSSWLRRFDRIHGEYSAPGTVTPNTRLPCEKLINDRGCS